MQADGRTDMTKLIVAFRNFAKAPKNSRLFIKPLCQQYTFTEVILTVHRRYYVEIKCQLDATDDIYCRFYCMLNMSRGNSMPIIRSSRILYRWSLPVVFGSFGFQVVGMVWS